MPSYKTCKCGKIWNSYVIGTGSDTRTASPEIFIAREVPVRDGVIVANRRTAGSDRSVEDEWASRAVQQYGSAQAAWDALKENGGPEETMRGLYRMLNGPRTAVHHPAEQHGANPAWDGLLDGTADNEQEANVARWFNRWNNMRDNGHGQYKAPDVPPGWRDESGGLRAAMRLLADAEMYWPSAEEDERDFADWSHRNREENHSDKDRYGPRQEHFELAAAREDDSADSVIAGFEDWLMSQGTSSEALKAGGSSELESKLREYLGGNVSGDRVYEVMDRIASHTGYDEDAPEPFREQREVQRSRKRALVAPPLVSGPRWKGKTPGGPQGSGVGGLKQKTRYKGVSTPYLRALHQRMMTMPNSLSEIDASELLRELSFREILGAMFKLDAPGGTDAEDGVQTKLTNPGMSAPVDWNRRDRGGKWTRGDGHP